MNLIIKRSVFVNKQFPESETKELQNIENDFSKLELEILNEKSNDEFLDIGLCGWDFKPDWLSKKVQYLLDGDESEKA
jgi:hypothetical protein